MLWLRNRSGRDVRDGVDPMNRENRRLWAKGKHPAQQKQNEWAAGLARQAGLQRNTPMKRTPMKRGTKGINRTSKKRDVANAERRKVLAKLRQTRGGCEARAVRRCTGAMDDGHEVHTRGRGGSITDPDNILMVCRPCHDWITDHPREADCAGYTVPSSGTPEQMAEARLIRELWRRGKATCSSWCKVDAHEPNS